MPEASATGWRAARPLRHRPAYRRLLAGQAAGQLADGLAQIAYAQVVLFEVGQGATPWEIAKLLAATLLPYSLVGPYVGGFLDRWSRRSILFKANLLRALLVIPAALLIFDGSEGLPFLILDGQFSRRTRHGAGHSIIVRDVFSQRTGTASPSGRTRCRAASERHTRPCVTTARWPSTPAASACRRAHARSTRAWKAGHVSPFGGE